MIENFVQRRRTRDELSISHHTWTMNTVVHHGNKKQSYGLESRDLIRGRKDMPKSRPVLRLSVTYESFSKRKRAQHSMFLAASKQKTEKFLN